MKKLLVVTVLLILSTALVSSGYAQDAAEFYKGKNMTILCGLGAGGGSDMIARTVSSFLGPIIDARAGVINKTSAGGLVARNQLYSKEKPDGLTIMADPSGALLPNWLLDEEGVKYDIKDFEYIGAINVASTGFIVNAKGPYTTVDALKPAKGLRFGSSAPASLVTLQLINAAEILKLDAKIACGIKSSDKYLALQQNELDAYTRPIDTATADVKAGLTKILFTISLKRDKDFPDVPAISEFVNLTDDHKKLIKAIPEDLKMYFAPPGTPKDRVQYLREAFDKMCNDKGFQAGIKRLTDGLWAGSISGQELEDMAKDIAKDKQVYKSLYKDLIAKYVIR